MAFAYILIFLGVCTKLYFHILGVMGESTPNPHVEVKHGKLSLLPFYLCLMLKAKNVSKGS